MEVNMCVSRPQLVAPDAVFYHHAGAAAEMGRDLAFVIDWA